MVFCYQLFDHMCDSVGVVFLLMTLCVILGVRDLDVLFYLLQGSSTDYAPETGGRERERREKREEREREREKR
jgi:hypothetical protein